MTDQIPQMQLTESKTNFSGGVKQPCKHGSAEAKDGLNSAIVQSDNAPLTAEPSVAMMLQKVIEGGITKENVSALESLVGLYDRMQAKNAEREFNQAFAKLQSELRSVNATRTVPNKDGSPRYRFAPFED